MAGAVGRAQLRHLAATYRPDEQKTLCQDVEAFLTSVLERYYMSLARAQTDAPVEREKLDQRGRRLLVTGENISVAQKSLDAACKAKLEAKSLATTEPGAKIVPPQHVDSKPSRGCWTTRVYCRIAVPRAGS